MGKVGQELDIDFVVSTGDNFYEDGLKGVDDQQFEASFSESYTAKSLQKPWYLGKFFGPFHRVVFFWLSMSVCTKTWDLISSLSPGKSRLQG